MTNNEIKMVRSLGQKKFRDSLGLFTVEGEKMLKEAQSSGLEIEAVYRRDEIGEDTMSRISSLSSPSPVLAVVRKPAPVAVGKPFKGLYLALDSVRDPGNLGTVVRIADWFGVKAVFASPDTAELYNPKVLQASMGSAFRVPVVYGPLDRLVREFKSEGHDVIGTFLDGKDIYGMSAPDTALVVMGNESVGISAALSELIDTRVTIPSSGSRADSLNVAVATAVTVALLRKS